MANERLDVRPELLRYEMLRVERARFVLGPAKGAGR